MNETVSTGPAAVSRVPVRLVLYSIAGLWLCYFIVATIRSSVIGLELSLPMLSRRIAVVAASAVVTAALWPLLLLLERRALWVQAAAVCLVALPGSLLLAVINQAVFSDLGPAKKTMRIDTKSGISIRKEGSGDIFVEIPKIAAPPPPSAPPVPPGSRSGGPAAPLPAPPPTVPSAPPPGSSPAAEPPAISITTIRKAQHDTGSAWQEVVELAFGRYFVLLAWASIYLALAKAEAARSAERREGEFRRAAQASELRSLRYQINPHFLFNTLNSLSALVMTGKPEAAERMIQTLSAFYRRSLAGDPTGDLPLTEEIALQKLYLDIEAVRFPERLRVTIDVPETLGDVLVPGMILQPLVENSVKYAVAASSKPVTIAVTAAAEGDDLVLTVGDDGPGAPGGGTGAHGCGIGLTNVRDRVLARFGSSADLVTGPLPEGGYRTTIRLPLLRRT